MGIKFKSKSQSPPTPVVDPAPALAQAPAPEPAAEAQSYTILHALVEMADQKKHVGETLMLVHNETGVSYRVVGYDQQTQRVKLKGTQGELLNPRVTEREAAIYSAIWRE